jgi:hypothetical protein
MSSVTCVICGARKGGTNDWWVLFEAESGRAVWIGRVEEAESGQLWKPATVPFHLCGVECLYRKLNALLLPSASGSANGEKPPVLLEPAAGNLGGDPADSGQRDPASRLIAPSPLHGILRLGRDHKRTEPDSDRPGRDHQRFNPKRRTVVGEWRTGGDSSAAQSPSYGGSQRQNSG